MVLVNGITRYNGKTPWRKLLGVTIVFFCYLCIGAGIFHAVELPNLKLKCASAEQRLNRVIPDLVCNISHAHGSEDSKPTTVKGLQKFINTVRSLDTVGTSVKLIEKEEKIVCSDGTVQEWSGFFARLECPETKWSLTSSFIFSMVTITTIGYGNMVPDTSFGQTLVVIYSIVGLPIFGFFAFYWAQVILAIEQKLACRFTKEECPAVPEPELHAHPVNHMSLIGHAVVVAVFWFLLPSMLFCLQEDEWDFKIAIYYCFITLSTIGYGDYTAHAVWDTSHGDSANSEHSELVSAMYVTFVVVWMLSGLVYLSVLLNKVSIKLKMALTPVPVERCVV